MGSLYEFPGIIPAHFLNCSADLYYRKPSTHKSTDDKKGGMPKHHLLPSTSLICSEQSVADLFGAWSEEGLEFIINPSTKEAFDSIEIFIDTRDVKTSGYNTRFCHHFFFSCTEDAYAEERTHFRGNDKHALADANLLFSKISKSHSVSIQIPKAALIGFEPLQFKRLGFTYRINKDGKAVQHFSASSVDYKIEEEPSLWATLEFKSEIQA